MAKTTKTKSKRKSPVERVRVSTQITVVFPARNCSGAEANVKGVKDGDYVKFYESDGFGGYSSDPIGNGVRLDVLEAVVAQLKAV